MSQSSFENFKNGNGVPVFQFNEQNYMGGGDSSQYSTYLNVRTSNFRNVSYSILNNSVSKCD